MVWHPVRGIIEWNKGAEHVYGYSRAEAIGRSSHALLRTIHPVPPSELTKTLNDTKRWAGELQQYTKDGRKLNVESRQQIIEVDGETLVLETNHDISERKEWEARQKLMSRELAHRVKNSFAVLQAILRSTLKSSPNPQEFAAAFSGRLHSLAAAQDVLTTGDWKGAELGALIKLQLSHYAVDASGQLDISGPSVNLAAEHAAPFGLIINELATNALKFGALSVPDGKVNLTWQLIPMETDCSRLIVKWRENGGPPITAVGRRSYGSTLIERSLADAKVTSIFYPEGVVCNIEIELEPNVAPPFFV
jgi:two-component system CheB/CheR fusion protein